MKGISATMQTIVFIIVLLLFLGIYLTSSRVEKYKEQENIFLYSEIAKVKDTHYLLEKSLNTTLFLSTIQGIFNIKDGAELELFLSGYSNFNWFWYRTDPTNAARIELPSKNILGNYYELCNPRDANPRICIFTDKAVQRIITNYLLLNYLNKLRTNFVANGVKINITNINISLIWPAYDRVIANFASDVQMRFGSTSIKRKLIYDINISTNIKKIMMSGWMLVDMAARILDSVIKDYQNNPTDPKWSYIDIYRDNPDNKYIYTARIYEHFIKPVFDKINETLSAIGVNYTPVVDAWRVEFVGSGPDDEMLPGESGLYFHYVIAVNFTDRYQYYKEVYDNGIKFVKQPITFRVVIEDYLPVLDCNDQRYGLVQHFYFEKSYGLPDMICYPDYDYTPKVYTCNLQEPIPNLGNRNLQIGETLGWEYPITCTADGFQ